MSRAIDLLRAEVDNLAADLLFLKADVSDSRSELNALKADLEAKVQAAWLRATNESMRGTSLSHCDAE